MQNSNSGISEHRVLNSRTVSHSTSTSTGRAKPYSKCVSVLGHSAAMCVHVVQASAFGHMRPPSNGIHEISADISQRSHRECAHNCICFTLQSDSLFFKSLPPVLQQKGSTTSNSGMQLTGPLKGFKGINQRSTHGSRQ